MPKIDRLRDMVDESCVGKLQALWSSIIRYTSSISKSINLRHCNCIIIRRNRTYTTRIWYSRSFIETSNHHNCNHSYSVYISKGLSIHNKVAMGDPYINSDSD